MKKMLLFLSLFTFLFALPCSAADNLLKNAGFEQLDGSLPAGWETDTWKSDPGASRLGLAGGAGHTGSAVLIENMEPNDAKLVQTVSVKSNTIYHLSGFIKVEKADPAQKGANLSVLGVNQTSPDYKDTGGQWEYVELYGKTGGNQQKLKVAVRLGGYGSLTIGKAYFDDIAFEEVAAAPSGVTPVSFDEGAGGTEGDPISAMKEILGALLFGGVFIWVYRSLIRRSEGLAELGRAPGGTNGSRAAGTKGKAKAGAPAAAAARPAPAAPRTAAAAVPAAPAWLKPAPAVRPPRALWLVALAAALFVRLVIAPNVYGYPNDVASFVAWASHAASVGVAHFYNNGVWADYPPGYIYVLYLVGKLAAGLHIGFESGGMLLLVKLPPILADLATGVLLYRLAARRLGSAAALGLGLLYLFNPAVILNSSAWGQIDSFYTLVLVLSLLLLTRGRFEWAAVVFAAAVLIKPQALIFTPVLLFALARRGSLAVFARSAAAGIGTLAVLLLPFTVGKNPVWIVDLYKTTLASYPYATLNAFNLYAMLGQNWAPLQGNVLFLPYAAWGTVFIVAAVLLAAWLYFSRRSTVSPRIFFTALLLITTVFTLTTKMHERYLFPALALALLCFIEIKDRRLLYWFAGVSMTHFVNTGLALAYGVAHQTKVAELDGVLLVTSFANVALWAWLVWIGYDLFVRRRVEPVQPLEAIAALPDDPYAVGLLHPAGTGAQMVRFTRRDWIGMGAVTLIYAAVALYHLGSAHSPETVWQPKYDSTVTIDLGAPRQIERVNTFGEIGEGKFKLEFSQTPDNWSDPVIVENTYTKVFLWNVQNLNKTARYVKVSVETSGFTLSEMAFYEAGGVQIPATIIGTEGSGAIRGKPANLFDEQDKAVYKPSYMNETYFDEIYHARTAYEHLHFMKPYENTHPPLGKLLIAVGIWLFGMDPFGWRIVGTVVGIAMIPLIYVFALRLFGRSRYALIAAFLLAVDFMHFAQTRIATIDVYGVFFIMLMFYFMYRYYSLSFYDVPLRKTLKPLFLSGLFFGIGAASKWIAIYGGAGLALLFFLSLYERYAQYRAAGQMLALPGRLDSAVRSRLEDIRSRFAGLSVRTVAWCALFFVVIPAVVYTLSFVPIMSVAGEKHTVQQLIKYQTDMYDYHSKLKATHAFASPWYEWPVMIKPIWFYTGQSQLPADQVSSIVSMGNPAIWWAGIGAVLAAIVLVRRLRHRGMFVVLVAYFSQYLPWMLVSRLTFIYHYFAMVPFLVLCIVYCIKLLLEKKGLKRPDFWNKAVYAYLTLCLILFVLFYPILSGMVVSRDYVAYVLRWFPGWYFY